MMLGGLQKTTLIDYPGKVAATVFTTGCVWRCQYCHNPELVIPAQYAVPLNQEDFFTFLTQRRGKLEAVCITGGEPTLHRDLGLFIARIKQLGFLVKLDTNGMYPEHLERILADGNIDYIAMDIKGPLESYAHMVGVPISSRHIQRSIRLIMTSGYDYEFRTTLIAPLLNPNDFRAMGELIKGAKRYFLQNYVKPPKQVVVHAQLSAMAPLEIQEITSIMKQYVMHVGLR